MLTALVKEKQRVKDNLFIPFLFVALLWLIKLVEYATGVSLTSFGIHPRNPLSLLGIFTSPLLHGDISHLFSNSVPIIVMGFLILHIYRSISWKVFVWLYLLSGLGTWLIGRASFEGTPVYHIGASGVVYGMAFFIFFSGIFRKDIRSIALSLLVVFLYGGIVWGLLPIQQGVSWEGHIAGAVAGTFCAYLYRKVNAPKPFLWNDEPEEDPKNVTAKPFWVREEAPEETNTIDIPIKDSNDILDWEVKYHISPKKSKD